MATFKLHGDFLTERIRDLWDSRDFKKAISLGLESLEGVNISHIISIIDGEMMLIGEGDLDLVGDGSYKPITSFLDVLDYAMLPNTGYFRIYEQDHITANKIIDYFDTTPPDSGGDDIRQNYIHQWNALLPEVRLDNLNRISHWMSVYMRKTSPDYEIAKRASFYSINLIESVAKVELNRKDFDKICDNHFIYSDREECWEQALQTRKMLGIKLESPSEEVLNENIKQDYARYKSDITMKSEYGWLSPNGNYKVCKWAEHELLASIICKYFKYNFTEEQYIGRQLSDVLLKIGYVKIHRDDFGVAHITHNRKLTPDQELKIDRYKAVNK